MNEVLMEMLSDINPDAVIIDGMDIAMIGIDERKGRAVYSVSLIIRELMRANDWNEMDAIEWYEFNISTAHYGEYTPILVIDMMDELY